MGENRLGRPSIQTQYDWSETRPSEAVISAIASLEDVDPVNLAVDQDINLYNFVDPEALDALLSDRCQVTVSFTIEEYEVQIDQEEVAVYDDREKIG